MSNPRAEHPTIQVWHIELSRVDQADFRLGTRLLGIEDQARADRLRDEDHRRNFLAVRITRRLLLGKVVSTRADRVVVDATCALCGHSSHGKPAVPGWEGSFSYAYRRDHMLFVASPDFTVGVDFEQMDRFNDDAVSAISRMVLSPGEKAQLTHLQPLERKRFVSSAWVAKEAVLKASGLGLARDPRGVVLASDFRGAHDGTDSWSLAYPRIRATHAAAVASRPSGATLDVVSSSLGELLGGFVQRL